MSLARRANLGILRPQPPMAFIDARTLPDGHRIESDLCIIGSGAAGLAIASEFKGRSQRVVLLESGGLEVDPKIQALNEGRIVGLPYLDLRRAWLRAFGGTTNHWTAHVRPLDPIDFEPRPWVPHSGWPFRSAALTPFYARAQRFLQLPEHPFDVEAWEQGDRYRAWRFEGGQVRTLVVQVVPIKHARLGQVFRKSIAADKKIDTYLFATVQEIEPDGSVQRVLRLRVATPTGNAFTVSSRCYVLAAGGIENARLLLLSSSVQQEGLGNQNDLVGRFFANHPEAGVGQLYLSDRRLKSDFYSGRRHRDGSMRAALALADGAQREAELLNARFHPTRWIDDLARTWESEGLRALRGIFRDLTAHRPRADLERHVANLIVDMDALTSAASDRPAPHPEQPFTRTRLHAVVEQAPNPDSRVTLGDDRDQFGQRRVVLDWRLGDRDSVSVQRTMEILAREVGAAGLGRVRFPDRNFRLSQTQSYHHMGTTRMHEDPKQGVVDTTCRVHGIANLFVAGSSVFPTYGTANPTFTILALAFRLSDHLRGVLT